MSEMVERLARAMQQAGDAHIDEGERLRAAGQVSTNVNDWRDLDLEILARAAIEAMREPTADMVEQGSIAGGTPHARDIWVAMASTALR